MNANKFSIFNYQLFIILCILSLCTFSCRPQSDELYSYGQNDYQSMGGTVGKSFAAEFDALWLALNENYGIWDYEEEFGTDWDEIYATYRPKFEALDDTTRQTKVTDEELIALYKQVTDTLHDGHMALQVKNPHTGRYIFLRPQSGRVARERGDEQKAAESNITDLALYNTTVVENKYQIEDYDEANSATIAFDYIDSIMLHIIAGADVYIAAVDSAGGPNATNDSLYAAVVRLKTYAQELHTIYMLAPDEVRKLGQIYYRLYQKLCEDNAFVAKLLGVEMRPIEDQVASDVLGFIRFALFNRNIAYLRIGGFGLTPYMRADYLKPDSASMTFAYKEAVLRVWQRWIDAIQTHHKAGDLGGVIIDVRNNGGGYLYDYQFVLGALLPSGGYASHVLRTKNGTGRLDFGPLVPFIFPTLEKEHEVINDRPIVVLANCASVSMAEMTTYGVMSQPNGHFIGGRTFGGLSALNTLPEYYSETYSGAFGVQNVTPIWGYVPKYIGLFPDKDGVPRIMEGVGFTPDEEVPLDVQLWQTAKRDNQLERALDYLFN